MPMAMAITGFIARLRHKPQDRPATEAAVRHLLDGWDALLQGGWDGPVVGALLNTGFDMLTLALLFLAAGHGVNIAVLVAGYGVPQLLGKLTVILGGIGVVEATMIGLYDTLGVPGTIAVVLGIAFFRFGCRRWPASRSRPILSTGPARRARLWMRWALVPFSGTCQACRR